MSKKPPATVVNCFFPRLSFSPRSPERGVTSTQRDERLRANAGVAWGALLPLFLVDVASESVVLETRFSKWRPCVPPCVQKPIALESLAFASPNIWCSPRRDISRLEGPHPPSGNGASPKIRVQRSDAFCRYWFRRNKIVSFVSLPQCSQTRHIFCCVNARWGRASLRGDPDPFRPIPGGNGKRRARRAGTKTEMSGEKQVKYSAISYFQLTRGG